MSLLLHRRSLLKPSTSFDPSTVAGMVFWLKADALALANNDPVGTWADSSTGGHDASQATASKKPTYKTNILNGKPAVLFDGVDDQLTMTSWATGTDWSWFAVLEPVASSDTYATLLTDGNNGIYYRGTSRKINAYLGADHLANTALTEGVGSVAGITASTTGPLTSFYLNGAADGTSAHDEIINNVSIIGDDASSETFKGYIAEMLVYNSVLSAGNLAAVTTYLKSKYGIA